MTRVTVEEAEIEIIRKVYAPGYSHAENIYMLLQAYERIMPADEAILRVHADIMNQPEEVGW